MKKPAFDSLHPFIKGYFQAAIFTELPDRMSRPGDIRERFDFAAAWNSMTRRDQIELIKYCDDFREANAENLTDYPDEDAGQDFWLTRNGHGCGFWENDHGTPEQCKALAEAARVYGSAYLERYKGHWTYHE